MKKITIAIDGFSSCGKSSMAKDLASSLGYVYVDTGAMYRTVTLYAIRHGFFRKDGSVDEELLKTAMPDIKITFRLNGDDNHPDAYLNGDNVERQIRTMEVSNNVSRVAAVGFVRQALVVQQQMMGKDKGLVMDGRDIGTVVFPDAELKIFVTASADVRAKRRFDELKDKGLPADYDDILRNVKERDYLDTHREISPLRRAADAIELDNSDMTIEQQNRWMLEKAKEKIE
jgi:cytidylate kinase